jgi:hypothetical protein
MTSSLFPSVSSEACGALSSVMIGIRSIPNSSSSGSVIPLLKLVDGITNETSPDSQMNKKQIFSRTILMADISRRLLRRKVLHNRL